MTIERETIIKRERPSEAVVVSGSNSAGMIGGIIAAILIVAFALWLFTGGLGGGGAVNVDLPEVTVTQ